MSKTLVKRTDLILGTALCLLIAAGSQGMAMSRKAPEPAYAPGQVLVKFDDKASQERITRIISAEKSKVSKVLGRTGIYLVLLPDNLSVEKAVKRFSSYPEVKYAEPNYRARVPEK